MGKVYIYGAILQLITYFIYFKFCRCICMIIKNLIWGKYKNETIQQLIIQLIYLKVCICIYRIISNITWGIYENGQYYI
jgi:hypothetical protein